ncbi:MAG: hypothetical protein J6Y15_05510 [Bacteroidaceae bacterium]|nr:hypothetical protein [Bacteroidaceae bacterium]
MNKLLLLTSAFMALAIDTSAQAPKGIAKIQKAIVSVNTYDKNGDLLNSGTAFYVGANGEAIADYSLFKNAYKATVIDMAGKQADVDCILGADDTYSVVRFKVNTKGNAVLTCTNDSLTSTSQVFVVPFSKEKMKTCSNTTIESQSTLKDKYAYYTLSSDLGEANYGSPLFNEKGELIGILQTSLKEKGYALDIRFRNELTIKAIATNSENMALKSINIPKGVPESAEEALVYTYFKSRSAGNEEYLDIMNRFIAAYPDNAEGYIRRCTPYIDLCEFDKADADMNKYLDLSKDKATAYYNTAQTLYNKLTYQKEPAYNKWTYDLAIEHINKSLELYKDNKAKTTDAKILKAQILSGKKDYDGAIAIYEQLASDKETAVPAIYYAMSIACESRGDSTSAIIALMDSAINKFGDPLPGDAANYVLRRGRLYAQIDKNRLAVQDYNQYCYLVNNKVSDIFYYDRSQIELKARLFQQAYDDINTAITMNPNKVIYYIEKAAMCLRFGYNDESIEACKVVLSANDKDTDALRILGFAQIQAGKKEEGKKNLQKAIDLGDENAKEIMEKYGN